MVASVLLLSPSLGWPHKAARHGITTGTKKATNLWDLSLSVPHTRVELVIYCVRGSCPGPLDECGLYQVISLSKSSAKVQLFSDMANFLQQKFSVVCSNTYIPIFYVSKYFFVKVI